jgi:hypothetical protein
LPEDPLRDLVGQMIVLDMSSPFVVIGRLSGASGDALVLDDADAHDLRDTTSTREKYVLDSRMHGVHPNRKRVWVRRQEVVAISRLEDVLLG